METISAKTDNQWVPLIPRDRQVVPAETNVLIVDDAADARLIMARSLEFEGFTCDVACDGTEALRSLRTNHYQLVILDLVLPDIAGFDLLIELQRAYPDLPVLVVSGLGDAACIRKAIELGATDYLVKPIMPEALALKVNTLIGDMPPNEFFAVNANLKASAKVEGSSYPCTVQAVSEVGVKLQGLPIVAESLALASKGLSQVLEDREPVFLRYVGDDWYHYIGLSEARAEKIRARVIRGHFLSEHSLAN